MILDSSALIAVIMCEPGAEDLLAEIRAAAPLGIGAPTLVETSIVLRRWLREDPAPFLGRLRTGLEA